jgi:hypothetical protein
MMQAAGIRVGSAVALPTRLQGKTTAQTCARVHRPGDCRAIVNVDCSAVVTGVGGVYSRSSALRLSRFRSWPGRRPTVTFYHRRRRVRRAKNFEPPAPNSEIQVNFQGGVRSMNWMAPTKTAATSESLVILELLTHQNARLPDQCRTPSRPGAGSHQIPSAIL